MGAGVRCQGQVLGAAEQQGRGEGAKARELGIQSGGRRGSGEREEEEEQGQREGDGRCGGLFLPQATAVASLAGRVGAL